MGGMIDLVLRVVVAVTWLAAAVLLSFGAAGIVAGIDHPAGPARPELTWQGDHVLRPAIDASIADLATIADDVEALGLLGRLSLSAMVARDDGVLDARLAEGGLQAAAIEDRATALRAGLASLPGIGPGDELRIAADLRARHARLVEAAAAPARLEESWAVLVSGSLAATRMISALEGHDVAAFAATETGRSQDYETALGHLDEAERLLADATGLRNRLANTIDTATLDEWLRRNGAYDSALRRLYTAFRDSGGRVTQEVRDAVAAERQARELLPSDTIGLVIIVAEIGRGGANQAVIEIELTRAVLEAALAALDPAETAPAAAAPAPAGAASGPAGR
jgi:hypothetical protein